MTTEVVTVRLSDLNHINQTNAGLSYQVQHLQLRNAELEAKLSAANETIRQLQTDKEFDL